MSERCIKQLFQHCESVLSSEVSTELTRGLSTIPWNINQEGGDPGLGYGRNALSFINSGTKATGIEVSPTPIKVAEMLGNQAPLEQSMTRRLYIQPHPCSNERLVRQP